MTSNLEKYALLSVSDKQGVVKFSRILVEAGYKIISTGGTAKELRSHNIPIIPIQDITGNPESFDGRMKTISFQIESGILYDRDNMNHRKQATDLNIKPIDIVVCNLYPFQKTIQDPLVSLEKAVEQIDVGGPTMIRAGAKNFKYVTVIVDPADYERVGKQIIDATVTSENRKELASKAFYHLSFYDSQIAHFLSSSDYPEEITLAGKRLNLLRYGENPHQTGAVYLHPQSHSSLRNLEKKWGRELSLINVTDINAGIESVRLFQEPAAVVIKHNSPSGIALGKTVDEALSRAIEADPESAFGGIIVLNTPINLKTAQVIGSFKDSRKGNIDIVSAPFLDADSFEYLKHLRKSMGIYTFGQLPRQQDTRQLKWIDGGFILQSTDSGIQDSFTQWTVVTKKQPTSIQKQQMQLAWKFISRIKSNAVIVVDKKIPMTRGIGSGQTSRVRSTQIALTQAGIHASDAVLASDSFFPFGDSIILAAKAGISAVIQQGGSINDAQSIAAADNAGITMVFTNRRAFWH